MLSDFYKILKLDDDYFDEVAEGADTLAGLMLMLKGEFPVKGANIAGFMKVAGAMMAQGIV